MGRSILTFLMLTLVFFANAQKTPLSQQMAATVMDLWADSMALKKGPAKWTYDQGLVLKGIENIWRRTGDGKYFNYIQKSMDFYVQKDGSIRTYKAEDYNIDNVLPGRNLLTLYKVLGTEKYYKAATTLREQLKTHPRTNEGGFWHKKIYPNQMWLDGLYMGEPFYAEYSASFNEFINFDDIANQFIWMENHARDTRTGLLYHGWDESKQQKWADQKTGVSPHFWGRAMGWYGMALVDVLDYFPVEHPKRADLIKILQRYASAVIKVQDKKTGLWWQILDKAESKGNYLEASASCMFVYTLAKAVRMRYLPDPYFSAAQKGYDGIVKHLVSTDEKGMVHLNKNCQVAGLGGNPYRDGSFEYYVNEPIITDDPKGMGPFLLASFEMEIAKEQKPGNGKNVMLDYYFNSEYKKDAAGNSVRFHYTWEDDANSGFSLWGNIFKNYGAKTTSLTVAPTSKNLAAADIYIIVDADTEKESSKPNYIQPADIKAISDWVKAGGVLVLMGNDSSNAEFEHFNQLAKVFGLQFNFDCLNKVIGTKWETGSVFPTHKDGVFPAVKKVYVKELSSLTLQPPAQALIKDKDGFTIMATVKYGKGTVFALGDPWIYNEYLDGRRLPLEYENFKAAHELTRWLFKNARKK